MLASLHHHVVLFLLKIVPAALTAIILIGTGWEFFFSFVEPNFFATNYDYIIGKLLNCFRSCQHSYPDLWMSQWEVEQLDAS